MLEQFVVYLSPSDAPGKCVVRRWEIHPGNTEPVPCEARVYDTLELARADLKRNPNLWRMPRSPADEPQIVEVWI